MEAHIDADKASLITVKTVLDLAKEIYESSKVDEKREILNFLFSNLEMKDKKAIITMREPFDKLGCFLFVKKKFRKMISVKL